MDWAEPHISRRAVLAASKFVSPAHALLCCPPRLEQGPAGESQGDAGPAGVAKKLSRRLDGHIFCIF